MFEEYFLIPLMREWREKPSLENLELIFSIFGSSSLCSIFLSLRHLFDLFSLRTVWLGGSPSPCASLPLSVFLGEVPFDLDHFLVEPILLYHMKPEKGLEAFEDIVHSFFSYETSRNKNKAVLEFLKFEFNLFSFLIAGRSKQDFSKGEKPQIGKDFFLAEMVNNIPKGQNLLNLLELDLPNPDELECSVHACRLDWLNGHIDQAGWFSLQSLIWELAYQLLVFEWSFRSESKENIDLSSIFQKVHF